MRWIKSGQTIINTKYVVCLRQENVAIIAVVRIPSGEYMVRKVITLVTCEQEVIAKAILAQYWEAVRRGDASFEFRQR
jgi:hypothetical protein